MQNRPSDNVSLPSDTLPEDEIDLLFQQLQPLAVPENMMQQLLARIQQLPPAQRYQPAKEESGEPELLQVTQDVSNSL